MIKLDSFSAPVQLFNWHLEVSSKCALKCSRCLRTEDPNSFKVGELSLDFIKKLFTPSLIENHVERITFSGGFGDPIYHSDLSGVVRYLKSIKEDLQITLITNGSYRQRSWWQDLGQYLNAADEIIFSIDGYDQESNQKYRVGSDWHSIMIGLEEMVRTPAYVRWSTIVFSFNENHLQKIMNLAKSKGVNAFYLVKSERFGDRYKSPMTGVDPLRPSKDFVSPLPKSSRGSIVFDVEGKTADLSHKIFKKIKDKQKQMHLMAEMKYARSPILPSCTFGYRGAYVDAEGFYYPCSWISHPYEKKRSLVIPGKQQSFEQGLIRFKERLNLNIRSLSEILNDEMWKEITEDWADPTNADIVCERKCLNRNDGFNEFQTEKFQI